jgi:hypothetical protein
VLGGETTYIKIKSVVGNTVTFDTPFYNEDGSDFEGGTEAGAVTISRDVPDMDFITSKNNRIYGVGGSIIYASALGDPTNFWDFSGLSTGSYQAAVGSDGEFTGIAAYSGDVLFFKSDKLYRLYGDAPSEYGYYEYNVAGIQAGSHKSTVIINEVLFFKGVDGVYAYTGGIPQLISSNLGISGYYDAVAGAQGAKYYISMRRGADGGEWGIWVYDTQRGMWHREYESRVIDFANDGKRLYYLNSGGIVFQATDGNEAAIPWAAEFPPWEMDSGHKIPTRLWIRLEMEPEASIYVEISQDNKLWRRIINHRSRSGTLNVPIRPRRCDSFRIRLGGVGNFTIHSIEYEYGTGSKFR